MTSQPQRPAFGTVLASHMAVATYQGGRWGASEIKPVGADRTEPGGACAALREHLLRGLQGVPPRGRFGAHVSHGPAYPAHAPERPAAGAARTGRGAAGRDGARGDHALPRRGAGGAGSAVPAADSVRHHGQHRRGGDPVERCAADGARKSGLGLFRRRHEAAAHPGRRREHALGGPDGHGQDRRQLRCGDGPDLERACEVSGRPSAVLSGRRGAGDRGREFPADPRRGTR